MTAKREQPVHGALDYEELERLGIRPDAVYDLSVNSNPYGPSPSVRPALAQVPIELYPDRVCLELRRTIQTYELAHTALPVDALLCGNGTTELIWAIARAFLAAGKKAALLGPTFGEYSAASYAAGATLCEYRTHASELFELDMGAATSWLIQERPALLWLCNPNNPTGTWLNRQSLSSLVEVCQSIGTCLVVDEAYWRFLVPQEAFSALEFVDASSPFPLLVLRSLTKDCALAGVRLGYVVGPAEVLERVRAHLPSWSVNAYAQAAGIAALADRVHLTTTLHALSRERDAFFQALIEQGLRIIPSRTHFCLIAVGDARAVRQRLLSRGILVRDCSSFGLPQYIRVATPQRDVWQYTLHVLGEVL
ncbi:aminotransferase [Dictyobacter sp. S3.2.2.5]|uniref:histidinol-phosphate transaminase n=1 Tax=Dictyobacter halimunensis TaxID=3026934 RepID=A0ABQ6FQH0_9CHLR|nr:aminotransferase [Dictyobacter sp. S3.2.2.5]